MILEPGIIQYARDISGNPNYCLPRNPTTIAKLIQAAFSKNKQRLVSQPRELNTLIGETVAEIVRRAKTEPALQKAMAEKYIFLQVVRNPGYTDYEIYSSIESFFLCLPSEEAQNAALALIICLGIERYQWQTMPVC